MAKRELPPIELLCKLLDYDPETGKLTWRTRPLESFATIGAGKVWNKRYAGKEAFTNVDGEGYKAGSLHNKTYTAHRIIWKLVHGEDPDYIDHIDRVRTNNALANLRNVTATDNARNITIPADNKSGRIGVCYDRGRGKWLAQIGARGTKSFLGYHNNIADAVAAREDAEIRLGYPMLAARPTEGGE